MRYRFHPGAENDLVAALDIHQREAEGAVAARFVDEIERAAWIDVILNARRFSVCRARNLLIGLLVLEPRPSKLATLRHAVRA